MASTIKKVQVPSTVQKTRTVTKNVMRTRFVQPPCASSCGCYQANCGCAGQAGCGCCAPACGCAPKLGRESYTERVSVQVPYSEEILTSVDVEVPTRVANDTVKRVAVKTVIQDQVPAFKEVAVIRNVPSCSTCSCPSN